MAVLFCWENRRDDKISLENLRLATELSDGELRKTLWSLVNAPKLKRQVLLYEPASSKPAEWDENTLFWINQVYLKKNFIGSNFMRHVSGVCFGEKWKSSEKRKNQLDRKTAAVNREE